MEYFDELTRFLAQCRTDNLKTSHFSNALDGFKVKISFGKGHPARVPWIAFLAPGQHISNGIYPFYLFYKNQQILVLAFGISETLSPRNPLAASRSGDDRKLFSKTRLGKTRQVCRIACIQSLRSRPARPHADGGRLAENTGYLPHHHRAGAG
ncbi:DUF3578 domain-containing protein [Dyadobacter sp. 676]|uniref:DUF3578 domain-containing protein n=1 Tax=Dyadobacter sp. 676 TaxID=3088362 RepID=A0AAU8FFB2_9BACT